MLKDITAALEKVTLREDIDAKRVCIVGMSYGGYAALMLATNNPQTYACSVSVAGVSDLNLFLRSPFATDRQRIWLTDHVGDPVADFERLKNSSPLYQANKLAVPLLLIHGAKDEVVTAEHSFRMKLILEKAHIPFDWKLFAEADHNFAEGDQNLRLYAAILSFVDKHLK